MAPKLWAFRGTKFSGKSEDFETFEVRYKVERTLGTNDFHGWNENQHITFLISVLEGKALKVVRATVTLQASNAAHKPVWDALTDVFKDPQEDIRAFIKFQTLTQKGDLETYICDFNTLHGLAAKVATLDIEVLLRLFVQSLQPNLRIGLAAELPDNLPVTQVTACAINIFVAGKG